MHAKQDIRVWDVEVRVFHWTLVVFFFTAYFTAGEPEWLHELAGYGIVALILFRMFWGFAGRGHARFSDFVRSPVAAWTYLRDLLHRRAKRYLGHNPAGALMILALLFSLLCTTGAGMVMIAAEEGEGPLAGWLINPPSALAATYDAVESPLAEAAEDAHEFFANFTLTLVFLHVVGVAVGSHAHRENLVRSMVTGCKRQEDE